MKRIFLPVFTLAVVLAGCTKNEFDAPAGADVPEYISASIAPETKVHLDGLKTSWHSSDRISLFAKSDAMHYYKFDANTEEGSNAATFIYAGKGTDATMTLDKNYCIYPDRGVTDGVSDNTADADGILTTRIVYGQQYSAANLLDHAPMVAVSDGYEFEFHNVASILRFNVKKSEDFTEACTLMGIKLESASQYLCGNVMVDTKKSDFTAVCDPDGSARNTKVELQNINVELTESAQSFCVVVFPATYPSGDLKITLVYNDGTEKSLTYPNELKVGAGKVQDINCTIKPEASSEDPDVVVTTGGIYEFNGHPHLTYYTASVEGVVTGEGITETGVIYQRIGAGSDAIERQSALLTYENVGTIGASTSASNSTNNIGKTVASSSEAGKKIVKLTNLAGGDAVSTFIYRYYAVTADGTVYGDIKTFKTEKYGVFVQVPAGTFTMGTDDAALGYVADYKTSPAHQVTLTSAFEIGKYEISAYEFAAFLNASGAEVTNESKLEIKLNNTIMYNTPTSSSNANGVTVYGGVFKEVDKKKPVTGVTYAGAVAFCEWKSENDADYGYRLPTEAEWEWAAKGADRSKGYKYSGSDIRSEVAKGKGTNTNVGRSGELYPNELGIYDMSGNAWEFVADRSDKNWMYGEVAASYYEFCRDGVTDPTGPKANDGYSFSENNRFYAVVKGGSSNDGGTQFCTSYRRNDFNGKQSFHSHSGFRIVRVKK